jgi:VIT1/CCC1 family predicted Fe2+/Mn2+ transporter
VSILADLFSQDTLHASSRKTQNAGFFTGLWAMMGGAVGISTYFFGSGGNKDRFVSISRDRLQVRRF